MSPNVAAALMDTAIGTALALAASGVDITTTGVFIDILDMADILRDADVLSAAGVAALADADTFIDMIDAALFGPVVTTPIALPMITAG